MEITHEHRRIHLVDVENLIGTGHPAPAELNVCADTYVQLGVLGPYDHVVVASNPFIGLDVGLVWDRARLVVRHGPSGADLALLDIMSAEPIVDRYAEIVLASGDAVFVDMVIHLQRRGVQVTIVARPDALSRRLRMAASNVVSFPDGPDSPPAAATKKAA